jgi:hypothetical protein
VKNLAHDWLKIKESEVLAMPLQDVLIECRMMKDNRTAMKAFYDKIERERESQNKKLSL